MFRKNIYVKNNLTPFKISRTKIDLFFDCKRCFYIDQRYGIKRPHGAALVINNYIVNKFKKNLNVLRETQTVIPETSSISTFGFTALNHKNIEDWVNPFKGIQTVHKKTNIKINANIDDVWTDDKECFPVIIKSISRFSEDIEDSIWPGYSRQLSLYGYLLSKNGINVGTFGIIVVINTVDDFNHSGLNFKFYLFKRNLEIDYVNNIIIDIKTLLDDDNPPEPSSNCKFCNYFKKIQNLKW